jgi:Ethanolamine utilization protein EutJ (predicted chaperonin)
MIYFIYSKGVDNIMKEDCLCGGMNLTMMSAEEVRAHIQKCEAELARRRNREKEEAWVELRRAFQKVFDAGIDIEIEDENDYFYANSMHDIDLSEIGKIIF